MKEQNSFLNDILSMFRPSPKPTEGFTVTKDLNGEYRWVGISTNRYLDREGEILSDNAHKYFEKYLDEHPDHKVELQLWHEPLTAMSKPADGYGYDAESGFFIFTGVLTEDEAKSLDGIKDARMSHGFYVLEKDEHIITKYISHEVSVLPGKYVANPYTEFTSEYYLQYDNLKEDESMLFDNPAKREFFVERLGEDRVTQMENDTKAKSEALQAIHTEFKELEQEFLDNMDEQKAKDVAEAAIPMVKETVKEVIEAIDLEGLNATIVALTEKAEENAGLVAKVDELTKMVEFLKSTEDDKLEKALTPDEPFSWAWSATKSEDNIVETEDLPEEAKKEVSDVDPEFAWMKGMTNPLANGGA